MLNLKSDARILIVRLTAIGDAVHALPIACALREALPKAYIAWIVEGRPADMLAGHPALDDVIVMKRRFWKSLSTIAAMRRQLRSMQFDATIDVQGLSKSSITAWLSAAPRRIGFDGREGREVSRLCNNERILPTTTHVIDRNLELLRAFGIEHPTARFELIDTPRDAAAAARMLEERRLFDRFALVNPGAGWPSKRWPPDRYAAVAKHLGQAHGIGSLIVWAGEEERLWAEQIAAGSAGHARIAPPTTLKELVAISRRAALFIGSDSAPLHLASAVDTPCIAIFGPTSGLRNGPYGAQHIVLQTMLPPPTNRKQRRSDMTAIEAVSTAQACAACDQLVSRLARGQRSA